MLRIEIVDGVMFYGPRIWVDRIYPFSVDSIFLTILNFYYSNHRFYDRAPNEPIGGFIECRDHVYRFTTQLEEGWRMNDTD